MKKWTRREFLKLGSGTLAATAFPLRPLPPKDQAACKQTRLGRITDWSTSVHTEPDSRAPTVRTHRRDDIVTCFSEVHAEGFNPNNSIWFRVIGGYIYSSHVQPVEVHLNKPLDHLPTQGLWGEISVPYTDARRALGPAAGRSYRLRYSSAYRILEAARGPEHRLWYRLYDNLVPGARHYVLAEHVRPILPEELEPLSPHVHNKRIEISLADQSLTAFENDDPVFSTHISGGVGGHRSTPRGNHQIVFKAPSRHMVGDDFDLPGVPFDSYFWGSIAIHGTYWHNDYGRPRSHGCVNVPSQAAKWIFRWTRPIIPYDETGLRVSEGGTAVIIF